MKKREFNKLVRQISGKNKKVSISKISELSEESKDGMAHYIIRNRGAVIMELACNLDKSWLHSMGYLYTKKVGELNFFCTGEHLLGL